MAKKQEEKTEKQTTNQAQATAQQTENENIKAGAKIRAVGPNNRYNGAQILRYKREDGRKPTLDIQAGMIFEVGEEITKEEAERLLNLRNWSFERVEG